MKAPWILIILTPGTSCNGGLTFSSTIFDFLTSRPPPKLYPPKRYCAASKLYQKIGLGGVGTLGLHAGGTIFVFVA
jgi:hypothetical protein